LPLNKVGLITLDAHFDMRETDIGPRNGNPVRCLLEDGLPGANICQIGLAPFANTLKMAANARDAGIGAFDLRVVRREGIQATVGQALDRLDHVDAIMVDFDIDVVDRGQCPGAPGARLDGMSAGEFFDAAQLLAADSRVRLVDLTEFDPSLDVSDTTALLAGRWLCEVLAGYEVRA
jgi:arginase family enzyme